MPAPPVAPYTEWTRTVSLCRRAHAAWACEGGFAGVSGVRDRRAEGAFILNKQPVSKTVPELNTVIRLIARRGAFLGRKGDGEPVASDLCITRCLKPPIAISVHCGISRIDCVVSPGYLPPRTTDQ